MSWRNSRLKNIISVLDEAVAWGEGVLTSLGETANNKYMEAAKKELRHLELDYNTEEEQEITSEEDSSVLILNNTTSHWKKKIISKRKNNEKREKVLNEAKIKESNRKGRVGSDIVHPIAREDFATLLNILIDFADDKYERTVTQTIKHFRRTVIKNIIQKKIEKTKISILNFDISEADCLIDNTEPILLHLDENLFEHKALNLRKHLTNQDKIKILSKMYATYSNTGKPDAPLRIYQKELVKVTLDYMLKKYPEWDEEKFRKRLKVDL